MKTWVNGELLDATKMNALEQSIPASATSSNGVVTFKNGNGTDLFTVAVQGSSYVKLGEAEFTTDTSSTTAVLLGEINVSASDLWTSNNIIYVSIRDKAGKRQGYFYGTDAWFVNPNPVNESSTASVTNPSRMLYTYANNGLFGVNNTATVFGVYAYDISSSGRLRIYARYSASYTLTINGTYHVEVYALSWADSSPLT